MPSRNATTARQVWWASVPVWSIGFLSPVLSPTESTVSAT
jgi:hypothetical protein